MILAHNRLAFGTTGTTTLASQISVTGKTVVVAIMAVGDGVWVSFDGSTPTANYLKLTADSLYYFDWAVASKITFLPIGGSAGVLNVVEHGAWPGSLGV